MNDNTLAKAIDETSLPIEPSAPLALSLKEANGLAKVFVESGLFKDTKDVAMATVKILAGYELGVGPFTAMRGINIIEGQLAPNAGITSALIKREKSYDYDVVESTNEKCTLKFYQWTTGGQKDLGEVTWTKDDAERAGLLNKYNWQKYPRAMLFARALTEGARIYVPHIFMGSVYTPEELGSEVYVDEDLVVGGETIDLEPRGDIIERAIKLLETPEKIGDKQFWYLATEFKFSTDACTAIKEKNKKDDGTTDWPAAFLELTEQAQKIEKAEEKIE